MESEKQGEEQRPLETTALSTEEHQDPEQRPSETAALSMEVHQDVETVVSSTTTDAANSNNNGSAMSSGTEEGVEGPKKKRTKLEDDRKEHRCKKCGRGFGTGQALGGHMRKHYAPQKGKTIRLFGVEIHVKGEDGK